MLDLCGLTAVNQLIQRQQLLWAGPALEQGTVDVVLKRAVYCRLFFSMVTGKLQEQKLQYISPTIESELHQNNRKCVQKLNTKSHPVEYIFYVYTI